MSSDIKTFARQHQEDLIGFAGELVGIPSYTGREENVVRAIEKKMKALGYDDVRIDGMGNIIGVIGSGEKKIMLDSHIDTVKVDDAEDWTVPPFSGRIVDNMLYGRGSVDMKSAAAASIYAGYAVKALGLAKGKTVYVSGTVMEEDCDGENLRHIFSKEGIRPDCVVICEPSSCMLAVGHKGKAQIKIIMEGVSAHGSAPEKGVNAVYKMAQIIQRVEALSDGLICGGDLTGTVVLSNIASVTASLNAVPAKCVIDLDRRLVEAEDEAFIRREMDALIDGTDATWEIGTVHRKSWTGLEVAYTPFHPAWSIDLEHELAQAAVNAYQSLFNAAPKIMKWDFSTNAVASVGMGIPTIGYGPGDPKRAHMKDEHCSVEEIMDACQFYTALIAGL
jgi:putative selenium metabolism hydrolase